MAPSIDCSGKLASVCPAEGRPADEEGVPVVSKDGSQRNRLPSVERNGSSPLAPDCRAFRAPLRRPEGRRELAAPGSENTHSFVFVLSRNDNGDLYFASSILHKCTAYLHTVRLVYLGDTRYKCTGRLRSSE